ncbi:uncharacterized protein LOC113325087 [Papaver somniferum]|uniref:uncharacterized protein LOC113325087 n=1 Tax=Papaver somniferum TaxID=3469 RepID=UPI000E701D79|nr:uncharacterized protein LOC113325087 [Papaver somniferum]
MMISPVKLNSDNYKQDEQVVVNTTLMNNDANSTGSYLSSQDRLPLANTLTDAHWEAIVNMFNSSNKEGSNEKFSRKWMLDTGASRHMTGSKEFFCKTYQIGFSSVKLPNGAYTAASCEGTVVFGKNMRLYRVLYVPDLRCNLISLTCLIKDLKCIVTLTDKLCVIQDRTTRTLIGVGEERDGVDIFHSGAQIMAHRVTTGENYYLWHKRLGHPSNKIISLLPGMNKVDCQKFLNEPCDTCFKAKQTRASFPISENKANDIFSLVHCDVWGPCRTSSSCGAHYFLTIVDDHSRCVWVYLMAHKTEVVKNFQSFCAMAKTQFDRHVKKDRSDNGTEFRPLIPFFSEQGIEFQTSCVDTPQQNGRVERKHRHILNVERALRFQANLPLRFWVFFENKFPYHVVPLDNNNEESQIELDRRLEISGEQPNLLFSDGTANPGSSSGTSGKKLSDTAGHKSTASGSTTTPGSNIQMLSGDCTICPGSKEQTLSGSDDTTVPGSERNVVRDLSHSEGTILPDSKTRDLSSSDRTTTPFNEVLDLSSSVRSPIVTASDRIPKITYGSLVTLEDGFVSYGPQQDMSDIAERKDLAVRRSVRSRVSNTGLKDYVCNTIQAIDPGSSTPHSSTFSGTPYPITNYVSCAKFSANHTRFLAAITTLKEPSSYAEAVRLPCWRVAMSKEINALDKNGTLSITDLPPGKKTIRCKWVYKIKYNSDGSVERYKARLVVLGNKQVEWVDYHETFAPVAKMVSVRTFLAVAVDQDWELHQMDVHNAFLLGDLDEEVYMQLPPGYSTTSSGKVCRLHKSLYGLRQAPRNWFAKLANILKSVLSYERFRSSQVFLGIEISQGTDGLFLSQRKYTLDILSETGLLGAKPAASPIDQHHRLALDDGPLYSDSSQYRRLIGSALRVLRYLKSHPGQGIVLRKDSALPLTAYCDSDWASCPLSRRSLTGYFIFLGGSPISWKTKKQHTISRSSAEDEYRSMAHTCSELTWLKALLKSLGVFHSQPMRLYCDSQSSLHIDANLVFHERTKHIEMDCHYVRDKVQSGAIITSHVRTTAQLADIFTKALGRPQFELLLRNLGIRDLHAPT